MKALQPGIYKLKADVVNPNGDGRHKYQWKLQKIWKAGSKMVAKTIDRDFSRDDLEVKFQTHHIHQLGSSSSGISLTGDETAYTALAEQLELVEQETISDILQNKWAGMSSRALIEKLIHIGVVNHKNLKEAIEVDMTEEEWEAAKNKVEGKR